MRNRLRTSCWIQKRCVDIETALPEDDAQAQVQRKGRETPWRGGPRCFRVASALAACHVVSIPVASVLAKRHEIQPATRRHGIILPHVEGIIHGNVKAPDLLRTSDVPCEGTVSHHQLRLDEHDKTAAERQRRVRVKISGHTETTGPFSSAQGEAQATRALNGCTKERIQTTACAATFALRSQNSVEASQVWVRGRGRRGGSLSTASWLGSGSPEW